MTLVGGTSLIPGHLKLTKLGAHHVAAYHEQRRASGEKPATSRLTHAVLHRALSRAMRWGLTDRTAAKLATPPTVSPPEIQPLSTEQARALLAAAEGDPLEALWTVLLTTGLRIGESLGLLSALIHSPTEKVNSANFSCVEFSEVRCARLTPELS